MHPLKILIIEDEVITAIDLSETLQEAGYQITAIARTVQEAVQAVRRNPPDMALIDIHLEGSSADGIATAKRLLAIHSMPIMYLTANSEPETVRAAKETLPVAYLLKPFRHDELKLQIEIAHHYFKSSLPGAADGPASPYLYLPVDKGHEKIDPGQVLYLEADGAYSWVYLTNRNRYYISTNLSHLAQYFQTPNFYRLSRSFVVNLNYVQRLKEDALHLEHSQTVIQVPTNNRKDLMKRLTVVRTK